MQALRKKVKQGLGPMSSIHSHGWKFFYFYYKSSLISPLKIEFLHRVPLFLFTFFYINVFDLVLWVGPKDTLHPNPTNPVFGGPWPLEKVNN